MTRTIVPIGVAALAMTAAVGGLLALSQGSVDAGSAEGRSGRSGPDSAAPGETAKLGEIGDPGLQHREAVAESAPVEVAPATDGFPFELASVSGVLVFPQAFDPSEPVMVYAWPLEGDGRRPVELAIDASAEEWSFDALPVGGWVFTARAVAADHCAWGKSKEVFLASGDDRRGVELRTEEFGVRGRVVDMNSAPLPGIQVRYHLAELDQTVRSIAHWEPPRDSSPSPAPDDRFTVSIGSLSEGLEYDVLVGVAPEPDAPGVIEIGYAGAEPVSPGSPSAELGAAGSAYERVFLEALTHGGPVESASTVIRSPDSDEPMLIRPASAEAEGLWLLPGGFREDLEQVIPAVPSSGVVTTDPEGEFWIAVPGPGRLTMTVDATSLEPGATDPGFLWSRSSVELTEDVTVTDHQITLERASALTGRVVRSDGVLEGIYVFIRSHEDGNTGVALTEADGLFSFSGKRPGRYFIYARSGGSEGRDFCTNADLQLRGGMIHRLDDVLTASSSLTGVVVDAEGQPVADVPVVAYGADNRSMKRSGRTDGGGVFTIVGMYAVDYTIEVSGKVVANGARFHVKAGGGTANAGTLTLEADPGPGH